MIAELPPEVVRFQLIFGVVLWVVFGSAGAIIARMKGANPWVGAVMGLMCGLPGLWFASRLPGATGRMTRLTMTSAADDMGGARMIAPEVAEKYGLPPQRQPAQWAPVVPPGAPGAPPGFAPQGPPSYEPSTAPPSWTPAQPAAGGPPTLGTPPPAPGPTGWWAPDPTGRYLQRWWDGAVWTHRVLDANGTEAVDAGA